MYGAGLTGTIDFTLEHNFHPLAKHSDGFISVADGCSAGRIG